MTSSIIVMPGGDVLARLPLHERSLPAPLRAYGARAYAMGPCSVVVGREPLGPGDSLRWHLSIATPDRLPTWDELRQARYRLLPAELTFAMLLPPPGEYVNAHPYTFHLHEVAL